MMASRWPHRLPRAASISASISVAPFGGRFRSRSGSLAGLPRRPARTKAAKRSARKLFDVVNAVLREFYNLSTIRSRSAVSTEPPIAPLTFLKAAFMFAASEGATSALITCSAKRGNGRPSPGVGWGVEPGRKDAVGR